jgi:uncharacterized RmlC-like cupin family protein
MSEASKQRCILVRSGEGYTAQQQLAYFPGVSAESAGANGICMHLLAIPPGGRAKAHLHLNHESVIYVLSGQARMWYGDRLEEEFLCGPGDFLYIPPGVPHLPINLSDSEPAHAIVARTDPNEQEGVILLPELDALH